jgi:hypothetical protein
MKTHLLASMIVFSTLACNKPPANHYSILIDPAFSSDQDQMIIDGANAWETATNNQVVFDYIAVADCKYKKEANQTCVYSSNSAEIEAHPGAQDTSIGLTEWSDADNSAEIFLDVPVLETNPIVFKQTIQHELGHSFRLEHSPVPGSEGVPAEPFSIMCWNSGCALYSISCYDVIQFEKLRGGFANCQ